MVYNRDIVRIQHLGQFRRTTASLVHLFAAVGEMADPLDKLASHFAKVQPINSDGPRLLFQAASKHLPAPLAMKVWQHVLALGSERDPDQLRRVLGSLATGIARLRKEIALGVRKALLLHGNKLCRSPHLGAGVADVGRGILALDKHLFAGPGRG